MAIAGYVTYLAGFLFLIYYILCIVCLCVLVSAHVMVLWEKTVWESVLLPQDSWRLDVFTDRAISPVPLIGQFVVCFNL